ncbi:MAG: alpha-hydroxy-acid oxidizing protein [Gammaproteobacteria bacterium]|jgi:(S)-2-hydroxy-acid oxidase/4-hydroxymandelate oxidase|nr:alpha-hydroxy-acid oxidizing protein [Gammaproteobacteria bacterium]
MKNPVAVADYRLLAKRKLSKNTFDFIDAGACDEITKRNNKEAFDNISLRPLCLRDVSSIDPSVSLLGTKISSPILIAPTAFHQLVDKQGEVASAKAAQSCGIPMVVSSMSNISLEDIATNSMNNNLWLQIYILKNRDLTEALIRRAEKAGYKAIVVSVGTPVTGKRDRDVRNQFTLPPGLSTGNFNSTVNSEVIYHFTAHEFDPSLTWQDIEWVKSITILPIFLKGILNPMDAENACHLNISGIVVSNHGGRQLDTSEATITVLPDIVKRVAGRTMVLMDGGITRGTDIFKSIALGADAILIGRPVLWALALHGEKGVEAMLNILKDEFEITMKLTGCPHIQEIKNFNKNLSYIGNK